MACSREYSEIMVASSTFPHLPSVTIAHHVNYIPYSIEVCQWVGRKFVQFVTHNKVCQVPKKLNIKVRVNKEQSANHELSHIDQVTVDLSLRVAAPDYKN